MIQLDNAVKVFGSVILDELHEHEITCWVAGGGVRDYFMGKPIKTDIDIFFPNIEEFEKCEKYLKGKDSVQIIWESDNGLKLKYDNRTFDLVKTFFKNPKDCINNFDFTVSMFAVDNGKVYYGETSFIDLSKRQLIFNIITYPASTLKRAFKYYTKGFRMCVGEMKALCEAIQNMPKENDDNNQEDDSIVLLSGDSTNGFFNGID